MRRITSEAELAALCQQTLADWPQARAALLFGSRARGDHRPDSDWDVAVVLEGDSPVEFASGFIQGEKLLRSGNIDVWAVGHETIAARAGDLGSLPYAVSHDGRLLVGSWDRPVPKEICMKPESWLKRMRMVLSEIETSMFHMEKIAKETSWAGSLACCAAFRRNTSNNAELLVKAVMERRGVRADHTHDISALAAAFAKERPDLTDLAARVGELNGHSREDHVAIYEDYDIKPSDCHNAVRRLRGTLDLWISELEETDSMAQMIPELTRSTSEKVNEWKTHIETPVRHRADDGSLSMECAMAVLDGRDQIRQAITELETRLKCLPLPPN